MLLDDFIENLKLGAKPKTSATTPRKNRKNTKTSENSGDLPEKLDLAMKDNMKLKMEIGGLHKEIRSLSAQNDSFREVIKDLSEKKPEEIKADPTSLTKLIEALNEPRTGSESDHELIRINDELAGQVKLLRQQISSEQTKFQELLIEKESLKNKSAESQDQPMMSQPQPTQISQHPTETLFLSTNYHAIKDELDVIRNENASYLQEISDLNEKITELEKSLGEKNEECEKNLTKWSSDRLEMEEKLAGLNIELENVTCELAACSVNLQEFGQLKETLSKSLGYSEFTIKQLSNILPLFQHT